MLYFSHCTEWIPFLISFCQMFNFEYTHNTIYFCFRLWCPSLFFLRLLWSGFIELGIGNFTNAIEQNTDNEKLDVSPVTSMDQAFLYHCYYRIDGTLEWMQQATSGQTRWQNPISLVKYRCKCTLEKIQIIYEQCFTQKFKHRFSFVPWKSGLRRWSVNY